MSDIPILSKETIPPSQNIAKEVKNSMEFLKGSNNSLIEETKVQTDIAKNQLELEKEKKREQDLTKKQEENLRKQKEKKENKILPPTKSAMKKKFPFAVYLGNIYEDMFGEKGGLADFKNMIGKFLPFIGSLLKYAGILVFVGNLLANFYQFGLKKFAEGDILGGILSTLLGEAQSIPDVIGNALRQALGFAGLGLAIGGPIGAAIGAGVGFLLAGIKGAYDVELDKNLDEIPGKISDLLNDPKKGMIEKIKGVFILGSQAVFGTFAGGIRSVVEGFQKDFGEFTTILKDKNATLFDKVKKGAETFLFNPIRNWYLGIFKGIEDLLGLKSGTLKKAIIEPLDIIIGSIIDTFNFMFFKPALDFIDGFGKTEGTILDKVIGGFKTMFERKLTDLEELPFIGETISNLKQLLGSFAEDILTAPIKAFKKNFIDNKKIQSIIGDEDMTLAEKIGGVIREVLTAIPKFIIDNIQNQIDGIISFFTNPENQEAASEEGKKSQNLMITIGKTVFEFLTGIAKSSINFISELIIGFLGGKKAVKKINKNIKKFLGDVIDSVGNFFSGIVSSIKKGITNVSSNVINTITNIGSGIINRIEQDVKLAEDIVSTFTSIPQKVADFIVDKISFGAKTVVNIAKDIQNKIMTPITNIFSKVKGMLQIGIMGAFNKFIFNITDFFLNIGSFFEYIAREMKDPIPFFQGFVSGESFKKLEEFQAQKSRERLLDPTKGDKDYYNYYIDQKAALSKKREYMGNPDKLEAEARKRATEQYITKKGKMPEKYHDGKMAYIMNNPPVGGNEEVAILRKDEQVLSPTQSMHYQKQIMNQEKLIESLMALKESIDNKDMTPKTNVISSNNNPLFDPFKFDILLEGV